MGGSGGRGAANRLGWWGGWVGGREVGGWGVGRLVGWGDVATPKPLPPHITHVTSRNKEPYLFLE